ncbi:spermatogenesis-associated protein 9 [Platysternon megacephalum]|uniref:Spermatogenesis-associated protein 9 n=1 Tax=Platysternon megacephalum TaxID=55544 RepID=A0A4D9F8J1_9SAUR|nr:spermatogenesis-associated protein 9 [Platysternon megacephalum]
MALTNKTVTVATDSIAVPRESIIIDKESLEMDREIQRQLMEAISSQNSLLHHRLMLGQQALQPCVLIPSHVLQTLNNTILGPPHNSSLIYPCSSGPRGHSPCRVNLWAQRTVAPGRDLSAPENCTVPLNPRSPVNNKRQNQGTYSL